MPEEATRERQRPGFARTIFDKALAPIVASVSTAVAAYLMRKLAELWQEKLQPKVEEKGGGGAVVKETVEAASAKVAPASEKLSDVARKAKPGDEPRAAATKAAGSSAKGDREKERRERAQRRQQRRRTIEQAS